MGSAPSSETSLDWRDYPVLGHGSFSILGGQYSAKQHVANAVVPSGGKHLMALVIALAKRPDCQWCGAFFSAGLCGFVLSFYTTPTEVLEWVLRWM